MEKRPGNQYRLPAGYGYMKGLFLAEQKGWKYALITTYDENTNDKKYENVGELGVGEWVGDWEYVSGDAEHELVIEHDEKIMVHEVKAQETVELIEHAKIMPQVGVEDESFVYVDISNNSRPFHYRGLNEWRTL